MVRGRGKGEDSDIPYVHASQRIQMEDFSLTSLSERRLQYKQRTLQFAIMQETHTARLALHSHLAGLQRYCCCKCRHV